MVSHGARLYLTLARSPLQSVNLPHAVFLTNWLEAWLRITQSTEIITIPPGLFGAPTEFPPLVSTQGSKGFPEQFERLIHTNVEPAVPCPEFPPLSVLTRYGAGELNVQKLAKNSGPADCWAK